MLLACLLIVLVALAAVILPPVIRYSLKERYFASEELLAHKDEIASVVAEHNEVAGYVSAIRSRGSFRLGASSSGTQAHLASFQNTSHYSYRRDRNVANYQAPNDTLCLCSHLKHRTTVEYSATASATRRRAFVASTARTGLADTTLFDLVRFRGVVSASPCRHVKRRRYRFDHRKPAATNRGRRHVPQPFNCPTVTAE